MCDSPEQLLDQEPPDEARAAGHQDVLAAVELHDRRVGDLFLVRQRQIVVAFHGHHAHFGGIFLSFLFWVGMGGVTLDLLSSELS